MDKPERTTLLIAIKVNACSLPYAQRRLYSLSVSEWPATRSSTDHSFNSLKVAFLTAAKGASVSSSKAPSQMAVYCAKSRIGQ
eukprot:scaffold208924_cov37-Prasinocladus_malaysianus.AAC.1